MEYGVHLAQAHPFVTYWLLCAILSTLPPLPPNSGFWLTWGYGFIQFLAANWGKIGRQSLDGTPKG